MEFFISVVFASVIFVGKVFVASIVSSREIDGSLIILPEYLLPPQVQVPKF